MNFRSEPKRFYPNGSIAAHVLGFVGIDGAGLGGVEQFYNEKITGEPGKLFIERDSEGNPYESFELPGTPGQTIVLLTRPFDSVSSGTSSARSSY